MIFQIDDRLHGNARRIHIHQQEGNAFLLLGVLVRAYQQEAPIGIHGECGPNLLAIHHIGIAIQHCFRTQRRQIRSRIGFGIALAPDMLTGQNLRQEALLLFAGAVIDQERPDHDNAMVIGARAAMAFHFFGEDDLLCRRKPKPTKFTRPAGAEPALLGQLEIPDLVFFPMQALRWIAQFRRVIGFNPATHMQTEGFIFQQVQILGFASFDHLISLR